MKTHRIYALILSLFCGFQTFAFESTNRLKSLTDFLNVIEPMISSNLKDKSLNQEIVFEGYLKSDPKKPCVLIVESLEPIDLFEAYGYAIRSLGLALMPGSKADVEALEQSGNSAYFAHWMYLEFGIDKLGLPIPEYLENPNPVFSIIKKLESTKSNLDVRVENDFIYAEMLGMTDKQITINLNGLNPAVAKMTVYRPSPEVSYEISCVFESLLY